jgi:dynein heavy chain
MKFLDRLKNFNKNEVPDKILKKVNKLINMEEFEISKIQRASRAAGGLAQWCKALSLYSEA